MTTNEEIHAALMVIDSRIRTLDGKVNLVARANRPSLLKALETIIRDKPMIGRVYLVLDGARNQTEVVDAMAAAGTPTSKQATGRWLDLMHTEHGLIEQITSNQPGKTYRKSVELDRALNLTPKVEKWVAEMDAETQRGADPKRRPKASPKDGG